MNKLSNIPNQKRTKGMERQSTMQSQHCDNQISTKPKKRDLKLRDK